MKACWEMAPEERPTFKQLYLKISKFIEHMADYMQMGYNPFTVERIEGKEEEEEDDEEKEESGEGEDEEHRECRRREEKRKGNEE